MLKTQELSIFDEVNLFFDDSAARLDLNDGLREMLKRSWRELLVQVPVRMDDGARSGVQQLQSAAQRGSWPLQRRGPLPSGS